MVLILLGLAVGGFTHTLFNRRPSAVMVNLGVGVMGAVMAGSLFNPVAARGAAVLSITDTLVAAVTGAVVLLAAYHATLRWTQYRRNRGICSDSTQEQARSVIVWPAARAPHILEDITMKPSGSLLAPADVFYVVQSSGAPGRREHHVASVLYETRAQAHTEFARLSAAHSGDYSVWKSTTYVEPPQWGHVVMRADGTVVPAG